MRGKETMREREREREGTYGHDFGKGRRGGQADPAVLGTSTRKQKFIQFFARTHITSYLRREGNAIYLKRSSFV